MPIWFRRPLKSVVLAASLVSIATSQAVASTYWVGSWAADPAPNAASDTSPNAGRPVTYQNQTLREIVHLSAGGDQLRVRLNNRYSPVALTIGAATVALRAEGAAIQPDTLQNLTFNGQATAVIPPGADIVSDPVPLSVRPQAELAVSLYIPNGSVCAAHTVQRSAVYYALENQTGTATFSISDSSSDNLPWSVLNGVDVSAEKPTPAVVAFGDSITDGYRITRDKAEDWPIVFSQRLQQAHLPGAVVNAGIGGNRILADGAGANAAFGVNALARFDADVLSQSSAHSVIVLLGINDIGLSNSDPASGASASAQNIEWGLAEIAARAHTAGLKIYFGTLTPMAGTAYPGYYSPDKEKIREAVNAWIRSQKVADSFVDFDKALRDPAQPTRLLPAYDSGDHLHPNDAGAQAIAEAIPLVWFK